jgi:membrane fusion protein
MLTDAQMTMASANAAVQPIPLFRSEVLAAHQAQWLGGIRVGRPLSFSLVTVSALTLAAALVAFACWGEVTRKVTLHGVLLPAGGLINVSAPQAGVIADVLVQENDEVMAGQPLLRIKSERVTVAGDAAALNAQALAARRSSLDTERRLAEQSLRQRQDAISQRLQSLQAEERQALSELENHRLRVQLGLKSLDRQDELARSGFVASAQVQQKQEELLDLQLRERNAERNLQALQRDLQTARSEKLANDTQARTSLTQIDRAVASLEQESTESDTRNSLILTAPQAGRISVLTLGVGQTVQPGQTLVSLVPSAHSSTGPAGANPAELQAQLYAPSRAAGFVQPGQAVWLRYSAFPYQKFGMHEGRVIAVSRSPISPQDFPIGQSQALLVGSQSNEPTYRITVKVPRQSVNTYEAQTPLVAGMSLDADVRQESRKVWEWMLEPVLAWTGGKKVVRENLNNTGWAKADAP